MYLKFWRRERRAESERISALASVLGVGATVVLEDGGAEGIWVGDAIVRYLCVKRFGRVRFGIWLIMKSLVIRIETF